MEPRSGEIRHTLNAGPSPGRTMASPIGDQLAVAVQPLGGTDHAEVAAADRSGW